MKFLTLALLASGCYATTDPVPQGCNPVMTQCNPADVPPLTSQLPWKTASPPRPDDVDAGAPDTAASRLLQKLGK